MSLDEASSVMKPTLFLVVLGSCFLLVLHRSWGRSRSSLWMAFFLHFATATAARSFVTATTALVALVTTATAAFATAAHRAAAAATARTVREQAAKAATERTTVATAARLTAAVAALSARIATTAAAVATEPESIGAARDGQHGHHQSNTLKVHLTHLHLCTDRRPMTSAAWRTGESSACLINVGRDKRAGESVRFVAPKVQLDGMVPVITASQGDLPGTLGGPL